VTAVDWDRYQQCDVCGRGLGKPCINFAGYVAGAQGGVVEVEADEPHSTRKLRAGYARTGGSR
jgi:hypothetical protein